MSDNVCNIAGCEVELRGPNDGRKVCDKHLRKMRRQSRCDHDETTTEGFEQKGVTPIGTGAEVCDDCEAVVEVL